MKRFILSIFAVLACMLVQGQQTWDFTVALSDADVTALNGDNTNWSYTESSNRYQNLTAIDGELVAGGQELQLTKGLKFTAAVGKLRIDAGKRVQLAGKNVVITIPGLKKGQTITVSCASTGDTETTLDKQTNLKDVSGFEAADKNTTQEGKATVAEDGDVTLSSTVGSMNIFHIVVGEASVEPGDEPIEGETHDVPMTTLKNQAVLTLNDGLTKFYNTDDLVSIDFDEAEGNIDVVGDGWNDTYTKQVANLVFTKAVEAGEQGDFNNAQGKVEIIESKGWLESAYVTFNLFSGATSYNVYVKGGAYNDFTKIDHQLVRNYGTYGRADVVGLKAGAYALKIVPVVDEQELEDAANEVNALKVEAYKREGFAFKDGYEPGAYRSDGTLKAGAQVIYVTSSNAKTIKAKLSNGEFTGLQAILAAYEKNYVTTPLAIRVVGMVKASDVDSFGSSEEGIQIKGKSAYTELNITIEGIGDDATIHGFGFLVRNAKSVEFRNLAIMRCMDDGISMDTDNSNIWVHHMDMFYGKHGSGDHDKGDGAIDVKADSKLVTVQYCHFWDTGKSNMFGMKSESGPNYLSFDHNWFDHSDSRHPRVRTMSIHVWNNYFDNVAKYGVGAATGSSVFVENNYFLKTKKPILSSNQGTDALGSGTFSGEDGGMIKAYGNYFDRSAKNFRYYTQNTPASTGYDAYETMTRDEKVPASETTRQGGTTYNNFDTSASVMYDYEPDEAVNVPAVVTGYYGAGRMNHGDFTYTFKDNVGSDDDDSAYDTALAALIDGYKPQMVSIFGDDSEQGGGDEPGGDEPGGDAPEGTIIATFNDSPSNSMFTVVGDYGDGKITYDGTYYKRGVKLNSKTSITFTPTQDYKMTIIMGTAKSGRDVTLNGTLLSVSGTENADGKYYVLEPVSITKNTQYTITKGSAEGLVMIIKLEPVD